MCCMKRFAFQIYFREHPQFATTEENQIQDVLVTYMWLNENTIESMNNNHYR